MGSRVHLCGTGNVCFLEGPLNACPTSPNSACRQHKGKSNLLNSLQPLLLSHDVHQMLFSQSYWPLFFDFKAQKVLLRLYHICNGICQY